jgi:glutathione S-transferase
MARSVLGTQASLGVYPGPYFGTAFGVADICAVPALERLAANLGFARGFDLRTNPEYVALRGAAPATCPREGGSAALPCIR